MHAAQLQPGLADLLAVAVEVGAHAADGGVGVAARQIGDDFQRRRSAAVPGFGKVRANAQNDFLVLAPNGFLGVIGRWLNVHAGAFKKTDQAGCVLGAGHRQFQGGFHALGRLAGDKGDEDDKDDGADQGADHQGVQNDPAVAKVVEQLFEEYGHHASSPSAEQISVTNASSRMLLPLRASRSSAVPSAATRPSEIMTMRSHRAATSCMMWVERTTQRPCWRSCLRNSLSARVVITSRPLVGSSSRMVRGS